jgi:hypothetical protein
MTPEVAAAAATARMTRARNLRRGEPLVRVRRFCSLWLESRTTLQCPEDSLRRAQPEGAAAAATARMTSARNLWAERRCRRRSRAKPERLASASPVVSCGTTPCEAEGSGLRCEHAQRANRTSSNLSSLPCVAITRGDATRDDEFRPPPSSRASLRSALVLQLATCFASLSALARFV